MNTIEPPAQPAPPLSKWDGFWIWFNARHEIWRWVVPSTVATVGIIVTVLIASVLFKPKIRISCGAVDFRIPARFKMELLGTKMGLMVPEMAKAVTNSMVVKLKEAGVSESRIQFVLESKTNSQAELTSRESGLVAQIMARAVSEFQDTHMQNMFVMPDAAMFFEIRNDGLRAAKSAHVVIRIDGIVYETLFDSDNKFTMGAGGPGQKIYELENIAPNSRTKGIIWYSRGAGATAIYTNEITVSCDTGTFTRSFTEDNMTWGSH